MTLFLAADQDPIYMVLERFMVTLLVLTIIIRFVYFRYSRKERVAFSLFQMGIMIFMVCILLQRVEIQLGVALGLFAIFAILRFRSEGLSLRDMTYFFTVIGVSVINSLATFYDPVRGTILINSIIILSVLILEIFFNRRSFNRVVINYDRLDLLDEERKSELLSDLSTRTRKKVEKVRIRKYDLIKSTVELEIFFRNTDSAED